MSENENATGKASRPPSFQLTPSQALKQTKASTDATEGDANSKNGNNVTNRSKNNNRRRKNGKAINKNNLNSPPGEEKNVGKGPNATGNTESNNVNGNKNQNNSNNQKSRQRQRQRQRQRNNRKGGSESKEKEDGNGGGSSIKTDSNASTGPHNVTDTNRQQASAKPKRPRRKPKKKYPWRRHIPDGTVDPITLDDLNTLQYPPFALCADEPYVPVPEWPIPSNGSADSNNDGPESSSPPGRQPENVDELNRLRLADQWGEQLLPSKESNTAILDGDKKPKASDSNLPPLPLSERPLNLFDGRALAFYMVSQLQFIDPFTRRDLTRAELQNLDRYLERHGNFFTDFDNNENNKNKRGGKKKKKKLKVTDAYDAKGITLSSAGAAAATAQGRADIMQQTAQQLLNSLFVGQTSVSAIVPNDNDRADERQSRRPGNFSLQEQYAATQRREQEVAAAGERRYERETATADAGFFQSNDGGSGGFMIIDDDENPEMRGRNRNDFPLLSAPTPSTYDGPSIGGARTSSLYSASHIMSRHGGRPQVTDSGAFPALPQPTAEATSNRRMTLSEFSGIGARTNNVNNSWGQSTAKPKKSKTLAKISGTVKKTTVEEKQKQWEAREAARKKAMMSNLTFGMNPVSADPSRSLLEPPTSIAASGSATEEQIERNRVFAEALGVKPATQRHYASGWARPTTTEGAGKASCPAHLDELEAALYPDALIVSAREHRMDFLLKLEKRWKRFLNDDKAASLPLNRMNRSARKFVHEYAEFWKLKTESFDPEPNRYIHCVKLQDTRMPQPLLSAIARSWRGPSSLPLPDATRTIASVMNDHTSHQTAGQTSRSTLEAPVSRPPIAAKLRSATAMSSSKGDLVALGETAVQNSRSGVLMDKERRQLKLLPRSVPLELPPFEEQLQQEAATALDLDEDLRRRQVRLEEKRIRERDIEQKKKKTLEDAFASDDERDLRDNGLSNDDEDSEWGDEPEALYIGNDED